MQLRWPGRLSQDPAAAENFNNALAGNMLWAATSLIPEWNGVMIPMPFAGGLLAGGALNARRHRIRKALAKARDAIIAQVGTRIKDIALQCGEGMVSSPEEQRKLLWPKLFSTPNNEAEPIRLQLSTKIASALVQFQEQYSNSNWIKHTINRGGRLKPKNGSSAAAIPGTYTLRKLSATHRR